MDNYSYILFNLPALAFFMSIYFLWKRAKCSRSICMYMSLVLFMMGVSIALFAQYFNPIVIEKQYWGFDFAYCLTSCFCAPIYFLFINKFAATNVRANVNMLAFLPSIIFAVLFIAAELIMTDVDRHAYVSNIIQGRNIQIEASMAYDLMVFIGNKVYRTFVPLQMDIDGNDAPIWILFPIEYVLLWSNPEKSIFCVTGSPALRLRIETQMDGSTFFVLLQFAPVPRP